MSQPPLARILVVDDNEQNRALARDALETEGYEVVLATSGAEGLRAFEEHRPDCVLLDIRMPGMDGTIVCSKMRALPHGSETPIVFLTAARDVETFDRAIAAGGDDFLTKPVRPSELLVRVQAALKVRRLGAELREQYELVRRQRDAMMRLQLQKERLSSFIVHDLKNPVNAMDLYAQLLLRTPGLPESARDSVQHIRDEARALLRLILNLLDVSKGEEGQLSPAVADVDLAALATAVLDSMSMRANERAITLEHDLAVTRVRADADLLRRVLENLLDNALRHAPKGSTVHLASARHDGRVEIRVRDNGQGIPPEMREKIFERFVQVETEDRVTMRAGRGLGLTFCKLAVEAHGGSIRVEDAAPGAAFVITLPDHG